jgi:dihydroflavonol-4-reductase
VKAAVTGANGLIGANLVRTLLRAGHRVIALVRPSSNLTSLTGLPIELRQGDVLRPDRLAEGLAGADIVFHAAAYFSYWGRSADTLETTAVMGTRNVLDGARRVGVRRIVLTSSSVVLGSSVTPSSRDETSDSDNAAEEPPYVRAKIRQEREAFSRADELGLELVAVCPTMSVGPHATSLGPSNAVIVTYLGDPLRMTYPGGCNIVAVGDVARGHILVGEVGQPGERYLLGGENLAWAKIHTTIAELAGVAPPFFTANHTGCYIAALAEEVLARLNGRIPSTSRAQAKMVGRYYWYDHAKAAGIGYSPRPARRALAEAIAWLAASPHISREVRSGLLLSHEVYEARRAQAREEAQLMGDR